MRAVPPPGQAPDRPFFVRLASRPSLRRPFLRRPMAAVHVAETHRDARDGHLLSLGWVPSPPSCRRRGVRGRACPNETVLSPTRGLADEPECPKNERVKMSAAAEPTDGP